MKRKRQTEKGRSGPKAAEDVIEKEEAATVIAGFVTQSTDNCGWEAVKNWFSGKLRHYWITLGEDWITTGLDLGGDWITTGLHVLRPNWSYIFTGPVSFTLSG